VKHKNNLNNNNTEYIFGSLGEAYKFVEKR